MKYLLVCFGLLIFSAINAQKLTLKQKLKIAINGKANPNFEVKYLNPTTDFTTEPQNETFDATTNNRISYQKTKKLNWSTANVLKKGNGDANLPVIFQKDAVYVADIKPEEGRLIVYFWPFESGGNSKKSNSSAEVTAVNSFIKDNSFSISLASNTSLSFHSSAWHVGVMTIPLKIFLGTADSVSSVQSSFNAGLYLGRRWGHTKYVNLPNQKEITTYETSWSLNIFTGLGKLDIDDKNTSDKGVKFQGSVAALSYGIMAAYHYKNFSLSLSFGDDKPIGHRADNWLLRKNPWLGLGFGFDIL